MGSGGEGTRGLGSGFGFLSSIIDTIDHIGYMAYLYAD